MRCSLIPTGLLALATLTICSCYRSTELGGAPEDPDFAFEWSEVVPLFEPDPGAAPAMLQGPDHRVVALDRAFVVVWMFNDGAALGIAMARFDWSARLEIAPTELLRPSIPDSPREVAAMALEDGSVAVYWSTERGELVWLRASSDGIALTDAEILRDDLPTMRGGLAPVRANDEMLLRVARDDGFAFLPLGRDGRPSGDARGLYPIDDPDSVFDPVDFGGATTVVWSERTPAGGDSVYFASAAWDGSEASMPTRLLRQDIAQSMLPFVADDALWVEVTSFRESTVYRLDAPGASFSLSTGPNGGAQWWPTGATVLAVSQESDEPYSPAQRLVYRHVDPTAGRVLDSMMVDEGACGVIEEHQTALRGALAVTWVDVCGTNRRLLARVRRPR